MKFFVPPSWSLELMLLLLLLQLRPIRAARRAQEQDEEVLSLLQKEDEATNHAAHLVKDPNPLPQATFHEGDPQVIDSFSTTSNDIDDGTTTTTNQARLVGQHRGPLTKKLAAVSKAGGMVETSLVAWKFASGSIEGVMEQRFVTTMDEENNDAGPTMALLTKARVDCMVVRNGKAVVGGTVVVSPTSPTTTGSWEGRQDHHPQQQQQRAFAALVDDETNPQLSNLEVSDYHNESCEGWAKDKGIFLDQDDPKRAGSKSHHQMALQLLPADRVLVCNRREGTERDWTRCLARQTAKPAPQDMMIMEEVVEWME